MLQPILDIRQAVTPFSTINISYVQSCAGGNNLPVLQGQNSDPVLFRIYNNFAMSAGISSAFNVSITIYDGIGVGSHTCALLPVSQSWFHVYEMGYGENSTTADFKTDYLGLDTAVGGFNPCGGDTYMPEVGSDGSTSYSKIRAGSDTNGVGFIEFGSYVSVPDTGVQMATYNFAISVVYEWFD